MENNIKHKWEFSKLEQKFIGFCNENDYKIISCKQYISKTKWTIQIKKDLEVKWETYNDIVGGFNESQFKRCIEMSIKIDDFDKREKLNIV